MKTARWVAAAIVAAAVTTAAWAADAGGKWTWKTRFGDNEITNTAEFKQEGEKLTGFITGGRNQNQKTEIKEGMVKGADVSFVVERERNGNKFRMVYKGKLEGDTIKGNRIITRNGQERSIEWTATRVK